MSCAAPEQGNDLPAGVDAATQSVVQGKVCAGTEPVGGAFVRLLDSTGEFTAEVVTSSAGDYRFYAAPGAWTVRALSRAGNGQASADVTVGINQLDIVLV
jgi:NADH:ubiquinone oxidoreductase subunit D